MRNLQEYGLWLVLVIMNAVVVSQWINYLIFISGDAGGLAAGLFLSIFLASWMFLLIRSVIFWFDRRWFEGRLQGTKGLKAAGTA